MYEKLFDYSSDRKQILLKYMKEIIDHHSRQ